MTKPLASSYDIRRLSGRDLPLFRGLLACFADAFEEEATYLAAQPSDSYLKDLLGSETFLALIAVEQGRPVGGLAAYELKKFEQERSEIYIYDLAVEREHRRRGIATHLILELKRIAAARGVSVVFVQADSDDAPAVALYERFGKREEVLHFDV